VPTVSLSRSGQDGGNDYVDMKMGGANGEVHGLPTTPPTFPPLIFIPKWYYCVIYVVSIVLIALLLTVLEKPVLEDLWHTTRCKAIEVGSLPIISIVFTYVHIWLALWMTFYPLRFVGWCQIPGTNVGLGWQGIIPHKAIKMAKMAVQLMTERLLDVRELFSRLDPDAVAEQLRPTVSTLMRKIVDEVAMRHEPQVWKELPLDAKEELYEAGSEYAPQAVRELFAEMRDRITECFDIEHMVIDTLTKDKDLLNQIFIRCGYDELCFIRNAGAWMGFVFGVIQAIIYCFYDDHWVLPVAGLIVGCFTNYIALKIIFEPVEPIPLCGGRIVLQGLFLKRQQGVAAEYGRTLAAEVCSARNILHSFLTGPTSHVLYALAYKSMQKGVDQFAGPNTLRLIKLTLGEHRYTKVKDDVCSAFVEHLPDCLVQIEKYAEEVLDMENTLRTKMASLKSAEFEGLLHPIFQEDEWKLVLMGGVLGVAIGLMQTYLINTGC